MQFCFQADFYKYCLFIYEFKLENKKLEIIKQSLEKQLENQYPRTNLMKVDIMGS